MDHHNNISKSIPSQGNWANHYICHFLWSQLSDQQPLENQDIIHELEGMIYISL